MYLWASLSQSLPSFLRFASLFFFFISSSLRIRSRIIRFRNCASCVRGLNIFCKFNELVMLFHVVSAWWQRICSLTRKGTPSISISEKFRVETPRECYLPTFIREGKLRCAPESSWANERRYEGFSYDRGQLASRDETYARITRLRISPRIII